MGDVISIKTYKKEKGITSERSPYSTMKATQSEIDDAVQYARQIIAEGKGIDHIYAVVIGYEDKKGDVRLLRSFQVYPSQYAFEAMAGMKTMKVVALIRKTAESE